MSPYKEYNKFRQDFADEDAGYYVPSKPSSSSHRIKVSYLQVILALSLLANILLLTFTYRSSFSTVILRDPGVHSGLERNILTHFDHDAPFNDPNRTISDNAWDNIYEVDPGVIRLSEKYVSDRGIPPSQPWPWNHSEQAFLLTAHHHLHCLKLIRRTLLHTINNEPKGIDPREGLHHALHCIEALRQDQICNADDTLWYVDPNHKDRGSVQSPRLCRDFSKLEAWASGISACYRDLTKDGFEGSEVEKYKFCPEGFVFEATGTTTPPWIS